MTDGLSRRQILAAATTTGAIGAVGTGSTGAFFTDAANFADNAMTAGSLDLEVCWESDDEVTCPDPVGSALTLNVDSLSPWSAGSGLVRVRLPETSNPAWLWGRSVCPAEACDLAHATKLTLWWDRDGDGLMGEDDPVLTVDGTELSNISLCRVRELLASGFPVDPTPGDGGRAPIEPGTTNYLGVSWRVTDEYCPPSEAALPFEFRAVQHRHNPEPTDPFPDVECTVICGEDCETECYPASFVAFCLNQGDGISRYDMTHLSWTTDSVTFEMDRNIDNVVLYYGEPTFEIFEGPFAAETRHTIRRDDGKVLNTSTELEELGMTQRDPCPEFVEGEDACGIRYNFDDPEPWDCVCGPSGKNRQCGDGDD